MARLPITTPHRSYGRDDEATRLIEADGARQRALALLDWRRKRDEGLRQAPEPEPVTPQTPPASYVPPMPLPEPIVVNHAPDPATIAERLKALDAAQLRRVGEAFGLRDEGEEGLRSRLIAYPEEWASEAADDAVVVGLDPEAVREVWRAEALGWLGEEIETVTGTQDDGGDAA